MTVAEAIASENIGIYGHSFKSRRKYFRKCSIPFVLHENYRSVKSKTAGSEWTCENTRILRLEIVTKTPHEYIRVTHEQHTRNISVHAYEYTNTCDNVQVVYKCTGYIRLQWQEDNKHIMYSNVFIFTFDFHMWAVHILHTDASAPKCHARSRITHMRMCYICTSAMHTLHMHKLTNLSADMMQSCASNNRR